MRQALIYLGLVRDPAANTVHVPVWGWLIIGFAVAAAATVTAHVF